MHQPAQLQIDATLAIHEKPHFPGWDIDQWQRELDKLIEVDRYVDIELDALGYNPRDVEVVNVITETVTIDATDCSHVPQRVVANDWTAELDWDDCETVAGRRIVRFDICGRG
jgi:hypothetical protein